MDKCLVWGVFLPLMAPDTYSRLLLVSVMKAMKHLDHKLWHQSCCFDLQTFVFSKLQLSAVLNLVIGSQAVAPKLLLWLANVCVFNAAAFSKLLPGYQPYFLLNIGPMARLSAVFSFKHWPNGQVISLIFQDWTTCWGGGVQAPTPTCN